MQDLQHLIMQYLDFCRYQKTLNEKSLKAYRIDLTQYATFMLNTDMQLNRNNLSAYISILHQRYKPKSAKRKIASLKAFFSYLEYEEILPENPFAKIRVKFKEPVLLPRTITIQNIQKLFDITYELLAKSTSDYQKQSLSRDIAVLELLFSTGLRVSELCSLNRTDIDLKQGLIRIYGKGSKERIIQIANPDVINALNNYQNLCRENFLNVDYFFCNRLRHRLSEQSVRFMIKHYSKLANITDHITPHMFRHTFASLLLEEDVDIRYIQHILGHSSIMTTQIYTHVTDCKQRDILTLKNPRNKIN
ncbi:tyrosine-type recombinase/integrase [Hungatella hathewayi]|uniref:tyrosine-type recombinase/integrase n=1 Tax=Hungatella hathewayi TaxID=154046 RepID=UPI003569C255